MESLNVTIYQKSSQGQGENAHLMIHGDGFHASIDFTGFISDGKTVFFEAGGKPTGELVKRHSGYQVSIYAAGGSGNSTVIIDISDKDAEQLLDFFNSK